MPPREPPPEHLFAAIVPFIKKVFTPSLSQRVPALITDNRCCRKRGLREIHCDNCPTICKGSIQGNFKEFQNLPKVFERELAWQEMRWDATFYCLGCWMKLLIFKNHEQLFDYFGWTMRIKRRKEYRYLPMRIKRRKE